MRQLFQALSKTSDGAFVINDDYKIIFWNSAAQKILGYSSEQAGELFCYQALGGIDEQGRTLCQRYCRLAMSARQGKDTPTVNVQTRTASGERAWINVTTIALPMGDTDEGEVIVHLFRDASQHKKNEQFVEEIMEMSRDLSEGKRSPMLSTPPSTTDALLEELTPRESEVLVLLAHGSSTQEIAEALNISPSTARNHIQSILEKLGVHSRLEAVAHAYQHGLLGLGPGE